MNKEEIYDYAYDLSEERRYSESIPLLEKLCREHPDFLEALNLYAGSLIKIDHFIEAARILLNAEKVNPKSPETKYNLGYALLCAGRVSDAMKCFEESLKMNPPKEAKKMAKRMLEERHTFEKNIENNYPISLEEEFECYDNFLNAQKLLYSNKEEKAIEIYMKILEKKPDHPETIHNIGTAYCNLNRYEKALEFFEKLKKKDELALSNLAIIYSKIGNIRKKEECIELIRKRKYDLPVRDGIRVVTALIELGEQSIAKDILNECRRKTPHPQLDFLQAVSLAKEGNWEDAKDLFMDLSDISDICAEYYEAADKLSKGKIKEYDFEPKLIFSDIQSV